MKKPSESFRDEMDRLRKEQGHRYAAIKKAFGKSPAIIATTSRDQRRLLIRSGETRAGGKPLRVTTFMVDGPWGHSEYETDDEIYQDLARDYYASVVPASDDDVMAWTSTPEFVRGAAGAAMIQAENELRYLAGKHGDYDIFDAVFERARQLARDGTTEAYQAAAEHLQDALGGYIDEEGKRLKRTNPSKGGRDMFAPNPAWVTRSITGAFDTINAEVPAKWHPKLTHARHKKAESFVARLKEYGCGAYGCVLPTLDDHTVLKVTTDVTEAQFAGELAATLVVPICVDYRLVMQLSVKHENRPVFLLWRESAQDVGKMEANRLINAQHTAAQSAYAEMYRTGTSTRGAITAWRDATRAMERDPELAFLAKGMLRVYDEQGIFFGDVHGGNVGRCVRGEKMEWVIIDPGHVSVVNK